jgi:hypothetical protein
MTPTIRRRYTLGLPNGRALELGSRTLVMGVLNVTPDSFSDGGRFGDASRAVDAALAMGRTSSTSAASPRDRARRRWMRLSSWRAWCP